jgi:hypothetical protein
MTLNFAPFKFHRGLGFEFELTFFLLLYFSVGYIVSLNCAFLDKRKQAKNRYQAPPDEIRHDPNCLPHPLKEAICPDGISASRA